MYLVSIRIIIGRRLRVFWNYERNSTWLSLLRIFQWKKSAVKSQRCHFMLPSTLMPNGLIKEKKSAAFFIDNKIVVLHSKIFQKQYNNSRRTYLVNWKLPMRTKWNYFTTLSSVFLDSKQKHHADCQTVKAQGFRNLRVELNCQILQLYFFLLYLLGGWFAVCIIDFHQNSWQWVSTYIEVKTPNYAENQRRPYS